MSVSIHIDTTDMHSAIVALDKDGKTYKKIGQSKIFKSQMVLPLLEALLKRHHLSFDSITAVSVATGPGSFTGLRVGCAVANALGVLLDVPVNGRRDLVAPKYS